MQNTENTLPGLCFTHLEDHCHGGRDKSFFFPLGWNKVIALDTSQG